MSILHTLPSITTKASKRLGRGHGSGKGAHTIGRGTKGHKARKDGQSRDWFEGGQLPLIKRLPMMRGKSRFNVVRPTAEITLSDLQKMKNEVVTLETLKLEKLIAPEFKQAKIIATGTLSRAVTVQGLRVSQAAKELIIKAGGQVQ